MLRIIVTCCFLQKACSLSAISTSASALARGESCEAVVRNALRQGLGSTSDVLSRARELDNRRVHGQADQLPLLGVSIFCSSESARLALEERGALIWNKAEEMAGNPRDPLYKLDPNCASVASHAVAAVAAGKVAAAVFPGASVPLSVAWTGVLALHEDDTVLCGSTLDDLLLLQKLLSHKPAPSLVKSARPLEGLRIGYSADATLDGAPVQQYVSKAMRVTVEMLEGLGADCRKLKPGSTDAFDATVSPAAVSAAEPLLAAPYDPLLASPRATNALSICLPMGCVAGEDDGYDSSLNELDALEGLPVAMQISAGASTTAALQIASSYIDVTRWSSEVFRVGQTRADAKWDIDDVREAFGIYFQSTLLRYLGKRR